MNKIRLTKEFNFEMAHALHNYDGACRHIHGHSYKFFVTVIGRPSAVESNPKKGMVLDFSLLKKIVVPLIIERYDHALLLPEVESKGELYKSIIKEYEKVEIVNFQPTCENLIIRFAEIIMSKLPEGIKLHHLQLNETATSYAEWYAEDNIEPKFIGD